MTHATQISSCATASVESAATRKRTDWTEERLTILADFFEAGWSHELMAQALGLSKNSITGKLDRLAEADPVKWSRSATIVALKPDRTANAAKAEERRAQAARTRAFEETIVGTPLLALNSHMCRWPMAYLNEQTFCADPCSDGSPYCAGHESRARVKSRPI